MNEIASIIRDLEGQRPCIENALSALREITGNGGTTTKATSKASAPRKRQMSEEGRQRIAEATRRRWANKRAADAKAARKVASNTVSKKSASGVKKAASKKATAKKRATKKAAMSVQPQLPQTGE